MRKFHEQAGQVVFNFGRFNPPTTGHEKLMDKTKQVAGSSPYIVFPSITESKERPTTIFVECCIYEKDVP